MQSEEIRSRFIEFFKKRGHAVLPSASLVPENDPSVLFTTAGMQPLVPYLLGQKHPEGNRLVNVQKCVRTQDIEEVGDATHDTFFEMLGNWSLGDPASPDGIGKAGYFKDEAIKWSYEFLTSEDEGLGLDSSRLYITCFEGDVDAPKDEESAQIWKNLGIHENKIYFLGKGDNWWSPGDNGPCGPDTEMFYDLKPELGPVRTREEFQKATDDKRIVEVWNDVFMEYEKKDGKMIGKLSQKNVDTGAGLERLAMVMQEKDNIFETDLFIGLMEKTRKLTHNVKEQRIIADHIRTAVFMISDGVVPSNSDRGYVLRRLLRRAVRYTNLSETKKPGILAEITSVVIEKYKLIYPEVKINAEKIKQIVTDEERSFDKTLAQGLRELTKIRDSKKTISGEDAFILFTTYGFPIEITKEFVTVTDEESFSNKMKEHQEKSRKGSEQKFKGGLADTSEKTIKYHTATHLLHEALRRVLGSHVHQRGSNITQERLRFDFSHPQKMTEEEKKKVEDIINEVIKKDLSVSFEEMSTSEAIKKGALGEFGVKYGEKVKVYSVGEDKERFSYEICGGPHVDKTGMMRIFKIKKEEASSLGIRRIKATLE